MDISILLGITASCISIFSYVLYNKNIFTGRCKPNVVTWGLGSFLLIIHTITYIAMSKDAVKGILSITGSAACCLTFIFALFRGQLARIKKFDLCALGIGLIATLVWLLYKNATYANLLLQLCFIISMIPTYRTVWHNSKTEKPLSWLLWAGTNIIMINVVILRWRGQYQDLAAPAIAAIMQISVALLSLRRPRARAEKK